MVVSVCMAKRSFFSLLLTFYFGSLSAQEIIFNDPVFLPASVNTPYEEINPLLSPDGKTLYFVRAFDPQNKGGKGAGMDIWISLKDVKGNWLSATNKTRWNNKLNNGVVGISTDSKAVYLINSYNNRSGIAFSKNLNEQWTLPETISIPGIEKLDLVGFYMNPTFSILLISMTNENSFGKEDLYVSLKDSLHEWSTPLNLGSTINTDGFETAPFLSKDNKRLYFTSSGHKGFGDADIFVSERLYDNWTLWSRPKNLGNKINSEKFDSYFSIYGDSLCYFVSNRASEFSDIYQSKVELSRKVLLRDSVNKIIEDTKELLSSLKKAPPEKLAVTDNIPFEPLSSILSNSSKNQIKSLLSSYNSNLVRRIELTSLNKRPLNSARSKAIGDYLNSIGINPSKINYLISNNSSAKYQDRVEIKIYVIVEK